MVWRAHTELVAGPVAKWAGGFEATKSQICHQLDSHLVCDDMRETGKTGHVNLTPSEELLRGGPYPALLPVYFRSWQRLR